MRFDSRGIIITDNDLGTILERGGEYADDPDFMDEAAKIARQSLVERSEELREILDQPFGRGLLKKLETLDDASEDELSRMIHMLTKDNGVKPSSKGELIFSYDHVMSIKSYVLQQIVMIEEAMRRTGVTRELQKRYDEYIHYRNHIDNYLEPVDVPDDKK